jgi:chromosome segregation ATPase
MQDNLKYLEKEIQKAQSNAQGARQQAEAERFRASQYESEHREGDSTLHMQGAEVLEQRANEHDSELQQLEARKAQVEARIAELKTQRETLNRETLDKVMAIDKELAALQGSLTI